MEVILPSLLALLLLALLPIGIYLILRRRRARWYLWVGILSILLFIAGLPYSGTFVLLTYLLVTGGSFGP